MKRSLLAALATIAMCAVLSPGEAEACGGCFAPPSESTIVTGHRMVMAVSKTQSVLWDQIVYSGAPSEFGWVLPVKSGAYIEVANDAWFETLEAATGVTVTAPPVSCGSGFSPGCGSSDEAASADFAPEGGDVVVTHHGTVGPYETVTLKTSTPGALNDWLSENGYAVDASTQPIIDAYVAEGFDFIALRLQPGAGVNQMKPVRVLTPGAGATLPLRMVSAGTGAQVPIVLYVIGEGRWATDNFPSVALPIELLAWDFDISESNYSELRRDVLASGDGRGWLTTFAKPRALFSPIGGAAFSFNGTSTMFQDVFAAQGIKDGEAGDACHIADPSFSDGVVVDPCPPGVPLDDPTCMLGSSGIDARTLGCGSLDDLAVALTGMHPADVWVTRLEAELPHAALADDLKLKAADRQVEVSNQLTARLAVNASCPGGGTLRPVSFDDRNQTRTLVQVSAMLLLMAFAARRMRHVPAPDPFA